MKLKLEINKKQVRDTAPLEAEGATIMVTPDIDDEFWIFRVPLTKNQAVVAFPKFCTFGIGFQHEEEDWNTN